MRVLLLFFNLMVERQVFVLLLSCMMKTLCNKCTKNIIINMHHVSLFSESHLLNDDNKYILQIIAVNRGKRQSGNVKNKYE